MELRNKKIIVTGGAGVIGQALIKKLVEKGSFVRCFDIAPKPNDFPSQAEYSQRDLAQLNSIEFTSFNPDVIFHLAATFERTEEDKDFWEFNFTNNVLLSHKVADAARFCENLKSFVFASSYLAYDQALYLSEKPENKPALKENSAKNPRNICGAAKYYTEKELEFLGEFPEYSFSKISARIYRVYGRNSRDFVSRSVRSALKKEAINLFSKEDGFDYIFADDVAEGLIRLSESDIKKGAYNLGTGSQRKIEELISVFKKHFPDLKVVEINTPNKKLFEQSWADMSAFKEKIGWVPETTLEKGIEELIKYESQKKI